MKGDEAIYILYTFCTLSLKQPLGPIHLILTILWGRWYNSFPFYRRCRISLSVVELASEPRSDNKVKQPSFTCKSAQCVKVFFAGSYLTRIQTLFSIFIVVLLLHTERPLLTLVRIFRNFLSNLEKKAMLNIFNPQNIIFHCSITNKRKISARLCNINIFQVYNFQSKKIHARSDYKTEYIKFKMPTENRGPTSLCVTTNPSCQTL